MSGDGEDEMTIEMNAASYMLDLYNNVSNFIYNYLLNSGAQGATGPTGATGATSASGAQGATAQNYEYDEQLEIVGIGREGSNYYNLKYSINDQSKIVLNIPAAFTLDSNGLVQLENNKLFVEAFNGKHKQPISLIQYYRFNNTEPPVNCVVIHLIIKVGVDDKATDTQNVYICVEYDVVGNIIIGDSMLDTYAYVYNNFTHYSKSKFSGVAPDMNGRAIRSSNQYLFFIQYEQMIQDAKPKNNAKPVVPVKKDEASARSPVKSLGDEYLALSVSTRMYDMYTHGVEGLGKIAEERYSVHADKIDMLTTETIGTIGTIEEQLRILNDADAKRLMSDIKLAQAVNDLIDLAHDFGKIHRLDDFIDNIYKEDSNDFKTKLKKRLNGLLSSSYNINVANSHKLQKANIDALIAELRRYGIIFPDIPAEKYLSRMQVFAEFIADEIKHPGTRSHFTESGKQVNRGTFQTYFNTLNEGDKILFNERVMRIMGAGATSDMGFDMSKQKASHPSIPKKIGLDGCPIGTSVDIVVDETITGVYGIFDVHIEGSTDDGFNITISRNNIILLTWSVPGNFNITYDDVAKYINKNYKIIEKYGTEFKLRGTNTELNNKYNDIEFYNYAKSDTNLQILLLECLKTFCDKIYRTSMKDNYHESKYNIANGVTHIGTSDSYVWGDEDIQFLAGKAASIPTTMRTGEGLLDDVECNDGGDTGKGFYTNPGVNSSKYVDDHYKSLLKKTLGYACFLQNLASECCVQPANSGSESDTGGEHSTLAPKNDVFGFRDMSENGKLFDTSVGSLGSLIDENIYSYRLINFVERFRLNYNKNYKKQTNDDYESTINELFQLECAKVIKNVQEYVEKLKEILKIDIKDPKNIKVIKKLIIELSDFVQLITMSTPSLCYENDDTLLLEPDVSLKEYSSASKLDLYQSNDNQSKLQKTQIPPSFHSLNFSSDTLTIIKPNVSFTSMQKYQLVNEYTIIDGNITGPITLDLLYALKKLAPNNDNIEIIMNKINEIINDFCSSCGLECNVSNVATQGAAMSTGRGTAMSTGTGAAMSMGTGAAMPMNRRKHNMDSSNEKSPYDRGFGHGVNGRGAAKSDGSEDANSRSYRLGYKAGKDRLAVLNQGNMEVVVGSDNTREVGNTTPTKSQMESGSGSESDNEVAQVQRQQERVLPPIADYKQKKSMSAMTLNSQLQVEGTHITLNQRPRPPAGDRRPSYPSGRTKSGTRYLLYDPSKGGSRNKSTRKRKPSKIPRRTIRRGRPRRGQKRTQKHKQKPRRTIRRRHRNKKGTQKRRK